MENETTVLNETKIPLLGPSKIESRLPCSHFENDHSVVISVNKEIDPECERDKTLPFEKAGPRRMIYFDPSKTKCAIVTCGGLCPGINDVIRAIVMEAHHRYRVSNVLGIRYGLEGFIPSFHHDMLELTPSVVSEIYKFGGTLLGTSRGPQPIDEIVDSLERMNIGVLFAIGGDGTMKAASSIQEEIQKRNLKISVIGIPKTIDNDIKFISRTFGFDTAVEKSTEAISCAHTEALCALNGVGLVKLMGRESGFIAAEATLALKEVNFVLIPEDEFDLVGPDGLLELLEKRLKMRKHAVIVVAEGAGQSHCRLTKQHDASGNVKLGDIGKVLSESIREHFAAKKIPLTLKFIDPSYIIRSVPANSYDRVYCGFLGQHAVHAAMAGRTRMMVSKIQDCFVHVPLDMVTTGRKSIDVRSNYWEAVLSSTGQPAVMRNS